MYKVELTVAFELSLYSSTRTKCAIVHIDFELPFVPAKDLVVELPGDFNIALEDLKWSVENCAFKAGMKRSFPSNAAFQHFESGLGNKSEMDRIALFHEASNDFETELAYYLEHGWKLIVHS